MPVTYDVPQGNDSTIFHERSTALTENFGNLAINFLDFSNKALPLFSEHEEGTKGGG